MFSARGFPTWRSACGYHGEQHGGALKAHSEDGDYGVHREGERSGHMTNMASFDLP